jgi:IS5 family transposase
VTLGVTPRQPDLMGSTADYCDPLVAADSIYGILHRECFALFGDEMFADLFTDIGRRSVPPMIVAVVIVLQRIEGCSDREAVDRFTFDARWKYAAGGLNFDYPGFVHTVLVDMRARLAASAAPDRIFTATLSAAKQAGLVGRKRVLDSTPLYDAVATMDTVTLIRSAIRGLLKAADADAGKVGEAGEELEVGGQLRAALRRDDDYATAGKPVCDYDDPGARVDMIDALAKDGHALLAVLHGCTVSADVSRAGALLATVLGQDLDQDGDGVFRIARRVAKDRVISTVDPETRHGHKTAARGFDGYKGHIGIDPDSEIITATTVTAGNTGDAAAAADLLAADLPTLTTDGATDVAENPTATGDSASTDTTVTDTTVPDTANDTTVPDTVNDTTVPDSVNDTTADADITGPQSPRSAAEPPAQGTTATDDASADTVGADATGPQSPTSTAEPAADGVDVDAMARAADPVTVYGDAAYGAGDLIDRLHRAGAVGRCKVQPPHARGGRFTKDAFTIDLPAATVTCPTGQTAPLTPSTPGLIAHFGTACAACPLAAQCTTATAGRSIHVGPYEQQLTHARIEQRDPTWKADYRATRPKVERKIGHLMRRRHGGRRARVRGRTKTAADFALLAAATNLARLATLGLHHTINGWATAATA